VAETKIIAQSVEMLGDPGVRLAVDRQDAEAVVSSTQPTETSIVAQSVEVLGGPSVVPSVAVDRQDAEAVVSFTGTVETDIVAQSIEVLGGSAVQFSVDRQDAEAMLSFTSPVEAAIVAMGMSVLAREQAAGSVVPRPLNTLDMFVHNWESQYSVTSSFSTSVSYSPYTQAESRRSLQVRPTRTTTASWQLRGRAEIQRMQTFFRRSSGSFIQIPVYSDQIITYQESIAQPGGSEIFATVGNRRFFRGGRVVARFPDGTVKFDTLQSVNGTLTVESELDENWPADTVVYPLMDVQPILQPQIRMITAEVAEVSLQAEEAPGESKLLPTSGDFPGSAVSYDGYQVFEAEVDWTSPVEAGYIRPGQSTVVGRGNYVDVEGVRPVRTLDFAISGTRADVEPMLDWFEAARGRYRAFWFVDIDSSVDALTVAPGGTYIEFSKDVNSLVEFTGDFEYVGLVMLDGTHKVSRVGTWTEETGGYRAALQDAFGDVNLDEVQRIAPARLMRFATDEIDEMWDTAGVVTSNLSLREVINEEEVNL
jgi:hypothetical protein